jgi:HD-GYP domain-containing protein (c-di-GMP phosphodiesterase class II)
MRLASRALRRTTRAAAASSVDSDGLLTRAPVFPRRLRDHWVEGHATEVAELAIDLGRDAGLSSAALFELELAARLHDVGKRAVPPAILRKPGRLSDVEWAVIRRHPEWGSEMLADVPGLEAVADAVHAHHEHWDGNGYPQGLADPDIPFASRIVAVCEAFSAMTTERPYCGVRTVAEALAELRRCAGTQFDPAVVEAFVTRFPEQAEVS